MLARGFRIQRLLAVAAIAVVAVASCGHVASGYQGQRDGHRVGVVGDSITQLSAPAIAAALKSRYQYRIVAEVGRTISEMTPETTQLLKPGDRPSRMIINLGTNDALQHNPRAIQQLETLIRIVERVSCVGWVTINPGLFGDRAAVANAVNFGMHEAARQHPQFHIIDWADALRRNRTGGWLQSDDIHPTPTGSLELARMYRHMLDHDCA